MYAPYLSFGCTERMSTNVFVLCSNWNDSVQHLEGIGAISKPDSRKAAGWNGNYQDTVTAPVYQEHDDTGVGNEEEETEEVVVGVSPSIVKVLSVLNNMTPSVLTADSIY